MLTYVLLYDWQNNMTYDLMRLGCIMGFEVVVAGPADKGFNVECSVVKGPHYS